MYHGLVVIFLEFFAWGLLTNPVISVGQRRVPSLARHRSSTFQTLNETFPTHTFLMNGVIHGVKCVDPLPIEPIRTPCIHLEAC